MSTVGKKRKQVRVTESFLFTSRVAVFTQFESVTELICERLLIYVLKKNKDLTRFLVHQQHIETRKICPQLMKYLSLKSQTFASSVRARQILCITS